MPFSVGSIERALFLRWSLCERLSGSWSLGLRSTISSSWASESKWWVDDLDASIGGDGVECGVKPSRGSNSGLDLVATISSGRRSPRARQPASNPALARLILCWNLRQSCSKASDLWAFTCWPISCAATALNKNIWSAKVVWIVRILSSSSSATGFCVWLATGGWLDGVRTGALLKWCCFALARSTNSCKSLASSMA